MNCINVLRAGASILQPSLQCIPATNLIINRFRRPSPCSYLEYPDRRPCFNICNVRVMRGDQSTAITIIPFLYEHYWSREPSICSLWMNLDNDYIKYLTDKFAYTGDRYLALEPMERTGECKVVGICVANKIFPWEPKELVEWADATPSVPERSRMYFSAHCYSSPNLWKKYDVQYIYEIEVLTTANEVTGQGVGTLLLKYALKEALLLRHPLIQVICTSQYVLVPLSPKSSSDDGILEKSRELFKFYRQTRSNLATDLNSKICERCGMKKEWSMKYADFVDGFGQSMFYPRSPHYDCDIYIKKFDQAEAAALPCLPEVY